jgi:hypothetical protein
MNKWLMRLFVSLTLLGLTACGGATSKIPVDVKDPNEKMQKSPAPPPIPRGPPKDAPRR